MDFDAYQAFTQSKWMKTFCDTPHKIPIALRGKVKEELDRMELGVIVEQREPTRWVNYIVTVTKPNGKIRICIDHRDINRANTSNNVP